MHPCDAFAGSRRDRWRESGGREVRGKRDVLRRTALSPLLARGPRAPVASGVLAGPSEGEQSPLARLEGDQVDSEARHAELTAQRREALAAAGIERREGDVRLAHAPRAWGPAGCPARGAEAPREPPRGPARRA